MIQNDKLKSETETHEEWPIFPMSYFSKVLLDKKILTYGRIVKNKKSQSLSNE